MNITQNRYARAASIGVLAALTASFAVIGTGCSAVSDLTKGSWAVTYEISVDQPVGAPLSDVKVEGSEEAPPSPAVIDLAAQETTDAIDGGSVWQREMIVIAEESASVHAVPGAGAIATCRILLDGTREIASETSAQPGSPVECSTDTPRLDG